MFKESRLLYETIESKSPLERLRILNSLESIYFKSPIEKRSVGRLRDNTHADNDNVDEVVSRKIHDYEISQVLVNQLKDIHKQIDHKTKTTGRTDFLKSAGSTAMLCCLVGIILASANPAAGQMLEEDDDFSPPEKPQQLPGRASFPAGLS